MADPVIVPCPVGAWTKVADNKTVGVIHIFSTAPAKYSQTYRATGNLAPTTLADAVPFDSPLHISASAAIDVYIWPHAAAGSVRADL